MKTLRLLLVPVSIALAVLPLQAADQDTSVPHKVAQKTRQAANSAEAALDKPDADARKVTVRVDERGVHMPSNLNAGKTAFVVKNVGKEPHNFEVRGSGLKKSFWIDLPPNESKSMQVDLQPGSYEADCQLKSHRGKEATVHLTVK